MNRPAKHSERCKACGQRVGLSLKPDDVRTIKRLIREGGITMTRIAQHYGVTLSAVSRIKRGVIWKNVT